MSEDLNFTRWALMSETLEALERKGHGGTPFALALAVALEELEGEHRGAR